MAYEEKWAGLCTRCGESTHEVIEQFPAGHRYERKPRRVGKRLKGSKRLHMLLTDGTQVPLTFCSDCYPEPEEYDALWRLLKKAWQREQADEHRKVIDPTHFKPYTEAQKKTLASFNRKMEEQAILGVHDAD